MAKVRMSPLIFEYRQEMAELVDQAREKDTITGVNPRERLLDPAMTRRDVPGLSMAGVLEPPRIESIFTDIRLRDGRLDGVIQIHTSDDFGVMDIFVTLRDDQGNHLESDYAMQNPYYEDHWGYIPSASLPSGTTVIVQAMARDSLGGVGIQTEHADITVR